MSSNDKLPKPTGKPISKPSVDSKKAAAATVKLKQNKKLKRRYLTWMRMVRYGANNFTRNAWLTTAATIVMTITLLILFTTLTARTMLADTVQDFREKIGLSVYLLEPTTEDEAKVLQNKLGGIENVVKSNFVSAEDAKQSYIKANDPTEEQLQAISELPDNPFPASLSISVKDPNSIEEIDELVKNDPDFLAIVNPEREPSYEGDRRDVIDRLASWTRTIEFIGLFVGGLFVAISTLIIFNTIRMAIFSRRDEIDMMKLIGADRNFIRGPFVVEAVMYGFIAAILATVIGVFALYGLQTRLEGWGVNVAPTREFVVTFLPLILIGMIAIGGLIGAISSRLAVRRYLRV